MIPWRIGHQIDTLEEREGIRHPRTSYRWL